MRLDTEAPLGPGGGADSASGFFGRALAASRLCGVTRLADITGLDRLGLPVWQAVRPAGRALSVHQGKGASHLGAKIGALCEAIESHCAENAPADGPLCRFADLAPSERAPEMSDFARSRDDPPDAADPVQWCLGTELATGRAHHLPHHFVSLDYTSGLPSRFERTSGGLGAGPGEADALRTALFEAIERDALGEWRRLRPAEQGATSLALDSIRFGWFGEWRERFAALDVKLDVFRVPSIVGVPVFTCVIGGREEFGTAYRRFSGAAAHAEPEIALFKALAEAIQSRLTLIAGVRDDILPSYYARPPAKAAGLPSNGACLWDETEPGPADLETIVERLAGLGYRQVVTKRLDQGLDGVAVTKVFVPGLGSLRRTRRPAR